MSLKIFLLGQFKLSAHANLIELSSRPAQSLLAYLALNAGITQRREKLAGLLWPDATESNARAYLRQALWRIRKSLENASLVGENFLIINDLNVTFNDQASYWLDVDAFLAPAENRPVTEIIEQVQLYRGDLLPGFYDEWVLLEQDRLQAVLHQKMNLLLNGLLQQQQWKELLNWGEEWIRLGQAPEPAYRALMQAYAGLGDMGMVCATYQRCVEALDRDLGLEPSPETKVLYAEICQGERKKIDTYASFPAGISGQQPDFLQAERPQPAQPPIFVARENELAQLHQFLQMAAIGKGRVVFVTGETGSGKTALINEFAHQAQRTNPDLIIAIGNCNAHTGIGDPYLPFREILELLTGDVDAQWAAGMMSREQAQQLWNLIPLTTPALIEAGPRLINTFVPGRLLVERVRAYTSNQSEWKTRLEKLVGQKIGHTFDPNLQQSDLFAQYTRVCQILASRVPLMLVIDDLQWADLGSISLLFHLGRHISGQRILIIGAYRPEEVALGREGTRHPLDPVVHEIQRYFGNIVIGLDQAQRRDFTTALLDSEPNRLGRPFREMLFQQTRGHPLFTVELLRGMQERGDLKQDCNGMWVEESTLDWETMPARIEAVIAERISRLPDPMQAALRVASVEGVTFTAEVVARLRATDEQEIVERFSNELERRHRLIRGQSIQRINGQLLTRYQFRHILFQKYLYSSLNEIERVHLHEQVGRVLEDLFDTKEKIAVIAPQLARHFQEAKNTEKAITYLRMAGERAVHLSAYQEGAVHLTRGLALLMTRPDSLERAQQELGFQISLSIALKGQIPGSEGEHALTRARELCQMTGGTLQLCRVLGELSIVHYVRAEYDQALQLAEEALNLAIQADDSMHIALCHWQIGFILFALGDFITAQGHLQQLIDFYDPHQHHQPFLSLLGSDAGVSALAYDACCLWCLGFPDKAQKRKQEAFKLARELDHAFSLTDVLCFGGCLLSMMQRDVQIFKEYADEMIKISRDKGFSSFAVTGTCFHGVALTRLGKIQEGIKQIRLGLAQRESSQTWCYISGIMGELAKAQIKDGDLVAGQNSLSNVLMLVDKTAERHMQAELIRLQGELHLLEGKTVDAEARLKDAIKIAQGQQAKSWELRATMSLARLWQEQSRLDEAEQLLASIYSWFTEGFDTPDLIAAGRLLEGLLENQNMLSPP